MISTDFIEKANGSEMFLIHLSKNSTQIFHVLHAVTFVTFVTVYKSHKTRFLEHLLQNYNYTFVFSAFYNKLHPKYDKLSKMKEIIDTTL